MIQTYFMIGIGRKPTMAVMFIHIRSAPAREKHSEVGLLSKFKHNAIRKITPYEDVNGLVEYSCVHCKGKILL